MPGASGASLSKDHFGWLAPKSAFGPKRTCRDVCFLAAFGGKADISQRLPNDHDLSVHVLEPVQTLSADRRSRGFQVATAGPPESGDKPTPWPICEPPPGGQTNARRRPVVSFNAHHHAAAFDLIGAVAQNFA
jgi:hypothetical protein